MNKIESYSDEQVWNVLMKVNKDEISVDRAMELIKSIYSNQPETEE